MSQILPDNVGIYRYMSFANLVQIVVQRQLFFPRADKFCDPFEGHWGRAEMIARIERGRSIDEATRLEILRETERIAAQRRMSVAVSCWTLDSIESYTMWEGRPDESVAIHTTLGQLRLSLADDPHQVIIEAVQYIDYDKERMVFDAGQMGQFLHKRAGFAREQEVRAITFPLVEHPDLRLDIHGPQFFRGALIEGAGIALTVNPEELIHTTIVSPKARPGFLQLVESLYEVYCPSAAGYVYRSSLDARPVYAL